MKYLIIISMVVLSCTQSLAQHRNFLKRHSIVYDLPDKAISMIDEYIDSCRVNNKSDKFFVLMSIDINGDYSLFIVPRDTNSRNKTSVLFEDKLVTRTNRVILTKRGYKLPVISDADLRFVTLEKTTLPDGRVMKVGARFINDSYSMKIDKYGNVL